MAAHIARVWIIEAMVTHVHAIHGCVAERDLAIVANELIVNGTDHQWSNRSRPYVIRSLDLVSLS